ncbi:glycosyltransferase WbsX family protein [Paenibacillus agricola]|uniref:Glycosyl transferase n=1 Tax=Paenibacillus agricola TaxID=2716264 RepID=A0ABX0J4Y5_9BACL|nr:glycoside hydrolase family 99-like domain-containing protein [Paenibacillus agricola]NHN30481.1 glycosyl transferase [Paenibacillus agricola]
MKLIAFYLPQFHETDENNRNWGKGFTEWTNTRKAQPLFPGHYQPKEPYQDYYYDLTDESAREWQAQIARKYGIYGFCYYHYWFKGKRFLHKPIDAVLQNGKPDFPFCLSWANDPWTRTWTGSSHEVLEDQDYGEKVDWKEHFEFLLTAFKDKRYIRVENKPLFLIYRPSDIPQCEEMLEYWQKLAVENGLDGIHLVQTLNRFNNPQLKGFDARIEFEPGYTMYLTNGIHCGKAVDGYKQTFNLMDYDKYWSCILERKVDMDSVKTYLGAFIDWDNSARVGGERPLIFTGASPEKFSLYLTQQIKKSLDINSDFLFINAWNEWAEGTYLEPDKKYEFQYLEALKKALANNGFCER